MNFLVSVANLTNVLNMHSFQAKSLFNLKQFTQTIANDSDVQKMHRWYQSAFTTLLLHLWFWRRYALSYSTHCIAVHDKMSIDSAYFTTNWNSYTFRQITGRDEEIISKMCCIFNREIHSDAVLIPWDFTTTLMFLKQTRLTCSNSSFTDLRIAWTLQ